MLLCFSAVLKVTDRLRRAELISVETSPVVEKVKHGRQCAQLTVVVVGVVRLVPGLTGRAAFTVLFLG